VDVVEAGVGEGEGEIDGLAGAVAVGDDETVRSLSIELGWPLQLAKPKHVLVTTTRIETCE
jgi:hypothetical protein